MPTAVAILVGDIHLSQKTPLARMGERNWFDAMARPLRELNSARADLHVPVLCAGDIFDRWNSPPELINFAIENIDGEWLSIPGQHDLPNHNYAEIERSAYWTLVKASTTTNIQPPGYVSHLNNKWGVWGYPWGFPPDGLPPLRTESPLKIALVHAYIWQDKSTSYPGAPEDRQVSGYKAGLAGFDVAVFGDNHIPFDGMAGDCRIHNCGGFFRRKSDEINHKPSYGVLFEDGSIVRHYLDISDDIIDATKTESVVKLDADFSEFMTELRELSGGTFDFREAVNRYFDQYKPSEAAKQHLLQAMDAKP